jgi:hypothetical protein
MAPLSEEEFQDLLRKWRGSVRLPVDQIRNSQEEILLLLTDQTQMERAVLFMSAVIGGGGFHMTSNTTNIGAAGVAITGGTSHGNITGNLQQNLSPEISKALADIETLRQKLLSSPGLNPEQKQDSEAAIQDVHAEAQKAPAERNPSRIRMALNLLASSVKLVDGTQHLYDSLAPHIMSLIHHL